MDNNIVNEEDREDERTYVTWVCAGGDSRMRPRGRAMSEGCGFTNARVTKRDLYNPPKGGIKGVCFACGRKRNLNPGIVTFHYDKRDMKRHQELENWDNAGWNIVRGEEE